MNVDEALLRARGLRANVDRGMVAPQSSQAVLLVLAAAVERVRALHRCHDDDPGGPAYCAECTSEYTPWPCPTIRAIEGES